MYRFIVALLIISFISVPVFAETTLGLELYPDRMDGIFDSENLVNGKEWFATTVEIEKTFRNFTLKTDIKTFLLGTNGFSYYPGSVKFTSSISYKTTDNFSIGFSHYCHHYFKQFTQNLRSSKSKINFKYYF